MDLTARQPARLKQAVAVDLDGQLLQLRWHLAAGGAEVAGDEDGDWRRFIARQLVGLQLTAHGDPQVADLNYGGTRDRDHGECRGREGYEANGSPPFRGGLFHRLPGAARLPFFLPFLPHLTLRTRLYFATLPFWPVKLDVGAVGLRQRLVLFSSSPFSPPNISRVNLVTGASGTEAKMLRIWRPSPFELWETESTKPTRLKSSLGAVEGGDEVGELAFATVGAQEDRAFKRLVEQRGDRLGFAVDRGGRALFAGDLAALNWTRVQTVPMWALSRNSERGRMTWALAMLASPGLRRQDRFEGRVLAALGAAREAESLSLGLKGRAAQSAAWKRVVTVIGLSSIAEAKSRPEPSTVRGDRGRVAAGRVEHEVGPVDEDADVAQRGRRCRR